MQWPYGVKPLILLRLTFGGVEGPWRRELGA
jgi:hypothetical protein